MYFTKDHKKRSTASEIHKKGVALDKMIESNNLAQLIYQISTTNFELRGTSCVDLIITDLTKFMESIHLWITTAIVKLLNGKLTCLAVSSSFQKENLGSRKS